MAHHSGGMLSIVLNPDVPHFFTHPCIVFAQMEVNGTLTYQADSISTVDEVVDHSGGARPPAKSIEVELSPVGNGQGKRGEKFNV